MKKCEQQNNKTAIVFLAASLFFSALSSLPALAQPVTIKGQRLSEISDIVKTVTSSDFPEVPKHSLLFIERSKPQEGEGEQGDDSFVAYTPRIFSINHDGSLNYETYVGYFDASELQPISPRFDVIQKQNVAISPKRFGTRRNIFTSDAGLTDNYNSRYSFMTLGADGTEENADILRYGYDNESTDNNRNIWGNACLQVQGMEDKDVFVVVHSSKMDQTGNLYLKFLTVARDETTDWIDSMNDISVDGDNGDSLGWKVFDYSDGIRGIGVSAAGDIDGDGYKNEFALAFNANSSIVLYIYQVTSDGDSLSVSQIYRQLIHDGYSGGDNDYEQACPNAVVGDFDGDGVDEAAFVGRVFPWNGENEHNSMRVGIIDYNGGSWRYDDDSFGCYILGSEHRGEAPCRVARCDFDGDGKDELAILFIETSFAHFLNGTYYPRLERWYCDQGSITPHRDTSHMKGGAGNEDTSVLGYTCHGSNSYYDTIEELQITAGPLTGTRGKAKLAEDVAISHVNGGASRVFVIPTLLDENGDFAGFGDTQKIYENTDSDSIRRGTLITADFLNESLMLDDPVHTQDVHDESYVAVLQALPYHVDNVGVDGTLTSSPINYTFSGFGNMAGGIAGQMSIAYSKGSSSSQEHNATFGLASTTETVSMLGDAGKYAAGYLKFRATEANIAGNFDPRIKSAAGAYTALMNFVTDKINTTTSTSNTSANTASIEEGFDARQFDRFLTYTAPQHIWRYKILNNPLPSWYVLGPKADYVSKDFDTDSQDRYMTFSMYDELTPTGTTSDNNPAYQARHEEGNFFSYPSLIEDIEGYTAEGALISTPYSAAWAKSYTGMAVKFEQSMINAQSYDEHIQKSELTKTVSAIASFFGADDPSPLPPYTSHSETFVKKYSTGETISIDVYGRTDLPGEAARHTLMAMPYTTREGTMKVGTAVSLINPGYQDSPALWQSTGRYANYPDPALVLPYKYVMDGTQLVPATQVSASRVRGLRFYVPSLDLDSDFNLLGGLQYTIKVPIYNASFMDADNFEVSLSYISGLSSDIDLKHPTGYLRNLKPIQTITMSLKGWQNGSRANKGWAEFTWDVPETLYRGDGTYYFYIQIDPGHHMTEVHESRLASGDVLADVGGNNEGYFRFNFSSPGSLVSRQTAQASGTFKAAAHSGNGTIFRTVYRSGEAEGGVASAATVYDTTGNVSINAKFIDDDIGTFDDVDVIELLGFIEDIARNVSSRDYIPITCELTYTGAEYYPEAYFYGVNYKAGALDSVSGDRSKLTNDSISNRYLVESTPLVPGKTTTFTIHIHPGEVDWVNGSGFELVVPELVNSGSSGSGGSGSGGSGGSEYAEGVSTSSGGCGAVTGSLLTMIFAGAMIFRKAKRR